MVKVAAKVATGARLRAASRSLPAAWRWLAGAIVAVLVVGFCALRMQTAERPRIVPETPSSVAPEAPPVPVEAPIELR